jgi:catechol 2,3-dioxygenase-like lactoylglutathione lyase family enzyme
MPRGLDHIVHAVRDLDAAADFYGRLGFTVGARNRHPWGTHNHIVQLPGFFIEILAVTEPEKLGDDAFSLLFGDFNRRFLQRSEGFSLLILESADAAADAAAFAAAGIAASDVLRFERKGRRPDGSAVTVAFSLVFAKDAGAPLQHFAVCQQHRPEDFWNADFQHHDNGVALVGAAVLVAENPTDHHIFLSAFVGERELHSSSAGITIHTPRGEVQVMTPAAFADHFGVAAPTLAEGARLAALRLVAPDLQAVDSCLAAGRIAARRHMGRIVVPADAAFGATLVFEAQS